MANKPTAPKRSKPAAAQTGGNNHGMDQSTSTGSTAINNAATGIPGFGPDASPIDQNYVDEFRRAAHQAVDWIANYLADPREFPVLPRMSPGELEARLPPQ